MTEIYPDYYKEFKCIASRCKHSCCEHWEIDIDDETYEKYCSYDGKLGEKIKNNTQYDNGIHSFVLGENGKCPFLNDKDLCDLIIEKGEDSLCDICREHPRFHNEYQNIRETGLGLCCEEAARIIIERKDPVDYIGLIGVQSEDESISYVLNIRNEIFNILHNANLIYMEKIEHICSVSSSDTVKIDLEKWAHELLCMEILDVSWIRVLSNAEKNAHLIFDNGISFPDPDYDIYFSNILEYFLFRYYPEIILGSDMESIIRLCIACTEIIRKLCLLKYAQNGSINVSDVIEMSRMFSSEIEYDDENLNSICDTLE